MQKQLRIVDIWLEDLPKLCEADSSFWNLVPGGFPAAVSQVIDYHLFWHKGEQALVGGEERFELIDYMWENGMTESMDYAITHGDFHQDHRNLTDTMMVLGEALMVHIDNYLPNFHLMKIKYTAMVKPDVLRIGIRR